MNLTPEQGEKLTEEISLANDAEKTLNQMKSHFDDYRNELSGEIPRTKHEEVAKREKIYRQLKSINTVEARLLLAIQTGKLAREQLTLWQKCQNKLKVI